MPFDYKKEYKEFYHPPKKPGIIDVPEMNYIAARGKGDPNLPDGEYKSSIGLLYGIAYTIKMSHMGSHKIDGYFPYVVPPLEGLWWQDRLRSAAADINADANVNADVNADTIMNADLNADTIMNVDLNKIADETLRPADTDGGASHGIHGGIDYARKEDLHWISMIRLPEFVTKEVFDWAVREATDKKQTDYSKVEFFPYKEGLCVQCMHIGSYDDEPETLKKMSRFLDEQGYETDFSKFRLHHEIYLSDPRRTALERLRTVIRVPVRQK